MKRGLTAVFFSLVFFLTTGPLCAAAEKPTTDTPQDVLVISGSVTNAQGKGVKEASIAVFVNEQKMELKKEIVTGHDGDYKAEVPFSSGQLSSARIAIEVSKPSYEGSGRMALEEILKGRMDDKGKVHYLTHKNLTLKRAVSPAFWIATLVLAGVYVLIAFEVMHRTLAAFLGAGTLLFVTYTAGTFNPNYVILTFEDAVRAIDLNVIFLLMAMMMIVGVLKKTGVFQWIAFKCYQVAKGNIFILSSILMVMTAVVSSFLDNVTTMILVIPVTINIAAVLKVNPLALLLPEVFASNVGGTATLIGDPPNIMIGSYAKLTFLDFVYNLTVVCFIGLAVSVIYFLYWYKKDYLTSRGGDHRGTMAQLKDEYRITDKRVLLYSGIMLGITIFLFIVHGALHMEPSIAAMIGAAVLLVISRVNIVKILEHEIEWPTLIFFMMLFIVVAGAEETGLIQVIADWVNHVSKGSLVVAVLVVLWVSALASAIIDNIPFTATMLPIVAYMNQVVPGAESGVLWWALALGACLGGNGTMIGASANVVTVGIAESQGYRISFMEYFKIAFIPMIITIVVASIWLILVEM
ncbi:MAG: ArsB/NhaD family transporter [Pseudomonadota bacterium]